MRTGFGGAVKEMERLKTPWIVLMVGVPGSGKSTFINKLKEKTSDFVIASSDNILEDIAKEKGITYNEAFDRYIKQAGNMFKMVIKDSLNQGKNVIIDRTQVGVKARAEHLQHVPKEYSKVAISFIIDENVLARRLDERAKLTGKVIPKFVIESMTSHYQAPSKREGFDYLIEIENNNDVY